MPEQDQTWTYPLCKRYPHGDPLIDALNRAEIIAHSASLTAYAQENVRIARRAKLARGWEPSGLEYRDRPIIYS